MYRMFLSVLTTTLMLGSLHAEPKKLTEWVEPGESKPAPSQQKSSGLKQATLRHSTPVVGVPTTNAPVVDVGPTLSYGDRLRAAYYRHICAPDGCLTPLGCGNFWTEKKFLFGSCRQFFGTAEGSVGVHRNAHIPNPRQ